MNWVDRTVARATRRIARGTSRRRFLGRLGLALAGSAAIPLLPVTRAHAQAPPPSRPPEQGDPTDCNYWRYCAIDGYLCACCGGSAHSCPPGTEISPITWIGTCRNPVDGRDYIISYNDCCGKSACGRCTCNRNEGDRPVYQPARSNDINWCHGTTTNVYHCSMAAVIGLALAD
jgi:methylamine dehydrogenase light chain